MNLYNILSTKPHNSHQLNRYINFINSIKYTNERTYSHHIIPKCMFPEFSNFIDHPWNKIQLTYKQHFFAHLLLSKIYKDSAGLKGAVILLNGNNKYLTSAQASNYEKSWLEYNSKFHKNKSKYTYDGLSYVLLPTDHPDVINNIAVNFNKGKCSVTYKNGNTCLLSTDHPDLINGIAVTTSSGYANYKDSNGNAYYLKTNDSRILTDGLVGHMTNTTGPNKNKVLCKNINTGKYYHIDKDEFKNNSTYVSVNAGRVPCINLKTKERKSLFKTDPLFTNPEWISLAKWRVTYKN